MSPSVQPAPPTAKRRNRWLIAVGIVVGILGAIVIAFLVWASTPLGPSPEALNALAGNQDVAVVESSNGWVFSPSSETGDSDTGLVFYPGGRVDARSYAPFALDLAARGHVVVIARMPLSLAVFDANAAQGFIDAEELDAVKRWAVGGHSLGGAMAAQYASQAPVSGLALLAAYAPDGADLRSAPIAVTDVVGTADGVLDQQAWSDGKSRLPVSATTVSVEGGNHAQFGSYGPQPGDNTATISEAEQRAAAVEAVDTMLDEM